MGGYQAIVCCDLVHGGEVELALVIDVARIATEVSVKPGIFLLALLAKVGILEFLRNGAGLVVVPGY